MMLKFQICKKAKTIRIDEKKGIQLSLKQVK